MTKGPARAVQLLVDEAWDLHGQGRYADGVAAAERAVAAARELDDLGAEVRALSAEAASLRMIGDNGAALARYSRVLALANDPVTASRLQGNDTQVAEAYMDWVACALFLTGSPWPELIRVLDEGEAWMRRSGLTDWRAGLLLQRARVLNHLGRTTEAIPHAEEALDLRQRHSGTPGYTFANYRWSLGDIYRRSGRPADAEPLYRAVLDDPAPSPNSRKADFEGLARCALDQGRPNEAVGHARAAVAVDLGDDVLCSALSTLVAAARAAGDTDLAAAAARRQREAATRVGSPLRLHSALRDCVDVALDRGEQAKARGLLDELSPLADALDQARVDTTYSADVQSRRARLDGTEPA